MELQTRKIDLSIETQIITAMIVSDEFIKEFVSQWESRCFCSPLCKTVGGWCYEYYSQYKCAPKQHIQDIYKTHCRNKALDIETSKLIATFLTELSQNYEEDASFNYRYILDKAFNYLTERRLTLLVEKVGDYISGGEYTRAEAEVSKYRKIIKDIAENSEILQDRELLKEVFADQDDDSDLILLLPGDVGRLLGPFRRDDFIALAGPSKRGKSWAMQEIAKEGVLQGRNVAWFSLGDMTKKQQIRRVHMNLNSLPLEAGVYDFPVLDCEMNLFGTCDKSSNKVARPREYNPKSKYSPCSKCRDVHILPTIWYSTYDLEALTATRALKKLDALQPQFRGKLRFQHWPRGTATMSDILATLDMWEYLDNFIPDLVITDYADIVVPENRSSEHRHQLNSIWQAHDSLAKSRHCVVVTGTHTTRDTLTKDKIRQSDVSDDIRKTAHISLMVSLNQTDEEHEIGVMRMGILYNRHGRSGTGETCLVLQQLDCGQFCTDSLLIKESLLANLVKKRVERPRR